MTSKEIASRIDHSILNPAFTLEDLRNECAVAAKYHTASVCVRPCDVALAAGYLQGSGVKVGTVIGFPHGSHTTAIKVAEARQAMADGAVELDMVLNIGRLLSGDLDYVEQDIRAVVEVARQGDALVKVILENCYLSDEQKVQACRACERAGADFVKTSTGYGTGGATVEDLRLMRRSVSERVRVKAAGGVRTLEAFEAVCEAGADRVGATATSRIVDAARAREV